MQSHSVPYQAAVALIQQVEPSFDTSDDFTVIVTVIDKVPHIEGSYRASPPVDCFECERYATLLDRRERESYPNVAE